MPTNRFPTLLVLPATLWLAASLGDKNFSITRPGGVKEPCPQASQEDAINAAWQTLSVCWFDAAACSEGLKALRSYRKEWEGHLARQTPP